MKLNIRTGIITIILSASFLTVKAQTNYEKELVKYYVAYSQLDIMVEYLARNQANFDRINELKILEENDISSNFYAFLYKEDFFGYKVYLVGDYSTHNCLYKVGIDSMANFLKINGFSERYHFPDDTTTFMEYNDKIMLPNSDVDLSNKEVVDLVNEIIKLVAYSCHPENVEIKKVDLIKISEKAIRANAIARCRKGEYDKWKIRIPKKEKISLQKVDEF